MKPSYTTPWDTIGAHKGHAFFACATSYLIDTDNAVILDVEASRAIRQAEVGSAPNLAWLVKDKKIAPLIPVFDKSNRTDGTFSRSDLTFDPDEDRYTVRQARIWSSSGALMRHQGRALPARGHGSIAPARTTVTSAISRADAARMPWCGKSRATSMRIHETSPGRSPRHRIISAPAIAESRSRCCLPTSSAY
jgi:hypothetical protein